jgi:hypothetical protein
MCRGKKNGPVHGNYKGCDGWSSAKPYRTEVTTLVEKPINIVLLEGTIEQLAFADDEIKILRDELVRTGYTEARIDRLVMAKMAMEKKA